MQLVGPIAPIFEEDYPYKEIDPSETLWRYLEFYKFENMLTSSTLYFSRPDKFADPFEGRFSPGNRTELSKSDRAFRSLYNMNGEESPEEYHETHRNVVFILCWHRNSKESRQMWAAYTKGSTESVAIVTSGKALNRFLTGRFLRSAVKYHDLSAPRTEFDHSALYFYKPLEYAFEREYRILRQPDKGEVFYREASTDEYRRIPIRIKKIVHRVIAHPDSTSSFKAKIRQLLSVYLPGRNLDDSSLR